MAAFNPATFRPLRNKVLVVADRAEKQTPGGIIVPVTGQRQSGCMGTVISTGPECAHVRQGQHVCFESFWSGDTAQRFEDEQRNHYYVIEESHVLAVINAP